MRELRVIARGRTDPSPIGARIKVFPRWSRSIACRHKVPVRFYLSDKVQVSDRFKLVRG